MGNRIQNYVDEVEALLRGRVSAGCLGEIKLEVKGHLEAACKLAEHEDEPEAKAFAAFGPPSRFARRYIRENGDDKKRSAVFLALAIACFFYLQPLGYYAVDLLPKLLAEPRPWIIGAAAFTFACIWARRSLVIPLSLTLLGLVLATTLAMAPKLVWCESPWNSDGPQLVWRKEAQSYQRSYGYQREARDRRLGYLREGANDFAKAAKPSDVSEKYAIDGAFIGPGLFGAAPGPFDWNIRDFGEAKQKWKKWQDILPGIKAADAADTVAAAKLTRTLNKGPWASWLQVFGRAALWGVASLSLMFVLNFVGWLTARAIGNIGRRNRGIA